VEDDHFWGQENVVDLGFRSGRSVPASLFPAEFRRSYSLGGALHWCRDHGLIYPYCIVQLSVGWLASKLVISYLLRFSNYPLLVLLFAHALDFSYSL